MDRATASLIGSLILGHDWQYPDNWELPKDMVHLVVMVLGSEEGRRRINTLLDYCLAFYQK